MTTLVLTEVEQLPAPIMAFEERARDYAKASKSDNTRTAYAADFERFAAWCRARGAIPLPAEPATVLAYLIDAADTLKVSSLQRMLVGIKAAHRSAGLPLDLTSEAFTNSWRGLRRTKGAPPLKKAPLITSELRRAVEGLPDTLLGCRDRALLLLGFAGALRRSELASLHAAPGAGVSYVETTEDGLIIHLARSKTDQLGAGADIGVPFGSNRRTCPVRSFGRGSKRPALRRGPSSGPSTGTAICRPRH